MLGIEIGLTGLALLIIAIIAVFVIDVIVHDNIIAAAITFCLLVFGFILIIVGAYLPTSHDIKIYEQRITKIEKKIETTKLTGKAKEMFIIEQTKKINSLQKNIDDYFKKEEK